MTGYIIVGIIMTVAVFVFVIMAMMKAASISDAVTERYMESVKEKNMTWLHTSIETSWVEGIYISAVTTA